MPRSLPWQPRGGLNFNGVKILAGRELRVIPFFWTGSSAQTAAETKYLHPIWLFLIFGWWASLAEINVIASTGQVSTQWPQPLQARSSIWGIKLVVWTGWRIPNFLAAIIASQQQPQQLQIKLTPWRDIFRRNWTRLFSYAWSSKLQSLNPVDLACIAGAD